MLKKETTLEVAKNDTPITQSTQNTKSDVKSITFVRKDVRYGYYSTVLNGKEIVIEGRNGYTTNNADEIKFLRNDPELTENLPKTKKK